VVERFVGPLNIRIDLFHIIDVIALGEHGVRGIQCCGTSFSAHDRKLLVDERENSIAWLSTPGTTLELWGWRKVKVKRGGKAVRYEPRIKVYTLADFDG
jgi:hypothetical protein